MSSKRSFFCIGTWLGAATETPRQEKDEVEGDAESLGCKGVEKEGEVESKSSLSLLLLLPLLLLLLFNFLFSAEVSGGAGITPGRSGAGITISGRSDRLNSSSSS